MCQKMIASLVLFYINVHWILAKEVEIPSEINKCLSSAVHKRVPSSEITLHGECSPWSNRSCCSQETAKNIHEEDFHHLDKNLCRDKPLSDSCKSYFLKDSCFFECSPNLGLWFANLNLEEDYQRYQDVPLCRTDCENWFSACSNDYTCSDNWFAHINVENNGCKKNNCTQIKDRFKSSKDFCEKIWDHAYKVSEDDKHCMRMSFNPSKGNPNDQVALHYYKETQPKNSASSINSYNLYYIFAILFFKYL